MRWLLTASLLLVAAAPDADMAPQLAGLFMQGCLPFAGTPARLRAWAHTANLPEVPEAARAAFLHGAPGQVFDASNPNGKFVLVSSDDGICAAVTNHAAGPAVVAALETDMQKWGIAFRMVIERDDKQIVALHHREYLAAKDGRGWRILAATVKDQPAGQAMLTAAPE